MNNSHPSLIALFKPESSIYRRFKCLKGSIIVIEGTIGVGKSTLGQALESELSNVGFKVKYYPEMVNLILLKQYLSNMKKYAYYFQMFMILKRIDIYNEASKFAEQGGIALIDRSVIGDMAFATMQYSKKFIGDEDWKVLQSVIENAHLKEPDVILYLCCSPLIAFERMIKRGNESEKNSYTIEYFEHLHDMYNKTINEIDIPIANINWEEDRTSFTLESLIPILEHLKKIIILDSR